MLKYSKRREHPFLKKILDPPLISTLPPFTSNHPTCQMDLLLRLREISPIRKIADDQKSPQSKSVLLVGCICDQHLFWLPLRCLDVLSLAIWSRALRPFYYVNPTLQSTALKQQSNTIVRFRRYSLTFLKPLVITSQLKYLNWESVWIFGVLDNKVNYERWRQTS